MIKLTNINKTYSTKSHNTKVAALNNVSLEVAPGEIFGIIGTSGAGKSTLLHMVNKLEVPDSGQVLVNDKVMNQLSSPELKLVRQEIGMIFQHFNLLNSSTAYDNIIFPLKINGNIKKLSRLELSNLVDPILELTGLDKIAHHYPSQLSGGQKQRVAIARSLITHPKVLLCDECTSALDPDTTRSILNLLKKINKELGVTILLITHEMEVIKNICHKIAVMSHGAIVEQGSVIDLFTTPKHEVTKKILSRSLLDKLPKIILDKLSSKHQDNYYPLLQLVFINETAAQPILSAITRDHGVDINILQGEIETIESTIIGRLIIQLEVDHQQFESIKNSFQAKSINIEILGYVPKFH